MRKKEPVKPLVGILCLGLVILAVAVAILLDSRSPNPILGIFRPAATDPTDPTDPTGWPVWVDPTTQPTQPEATGPEEEQVQPPQDLPPTVEIPTPTDPETGVPEGLSFPCQIPEYGLVLHKLAPYKGMFVEDGSNAEVASVAMLLVENVSQFPVEYTSICVAYGEQSLQFNISALPAGASLVVQEKEGKQLPEGAALSANAMVIQRAAMELSQDQIRVTDNGDNTITVENLTGETIPTVRVFYKYYMEQEDLYVGGIAFTVRITRLGAGAKVTVQPSHYNSQTSKIVMVLTYATEV